VTDLLRRKGVDGRRGSRRLAALTLDQRTEGGGTGSGSGSGSGSGGAGSSSVSSSIDSSTTSSSKRTANGGSGKWRADSDALRRAMSANKGPKAPTGTVNAAEGSSGGGGSGSALSEQAQAPAFDDGLQPCPHCSRRFSQKAGERHIPQCLDIRAKPKTLKKNSGKAAVSAALPPKSKLVGRII
jgi:hypothetical protein